MRDIDKSDMYRSMETRKQNRLKEYDYSQNGYYFITICTAEKRKILCELSVGANCVRPKIALSEIGKLVDENIGRLNGIYEAVRVDNYVIMPNHVHLILVIQKGRTQFAPTVSRIINSLREKSQNRSVFAFGKNPFMTMLSVTKRITCEFGNILKTIPGNGQRTSILFDQQIPVCRAKRNNPPKRRFSSSAGLFLSDKPEAIMLSVQTNRSASGPHRKILPCGSRRRLRDGC